MKEINFFDFNKEPGKKLEKKINIDIEKPLISIITPYYNAQEHIMQTANCVFNQTFPFWEWIIVDDCSKKENTNILEELKKMDNRIKIFYNKENLKLPKTRDVAISHSTTDLIYILDPDDLIDKTALETSFFAIMTHPDVTWVYSDAVGFGGQKYLWNPPFDTKKEKKYNLLTCNSLIRKEEVLKVGGYSNVPANVYEDWHLWLRLLANGARPLRMSYYSFWYRRHSMGVLSKINSNNKNKRNAFKEIKKAGKNIKKRANAIQYPTSDLYEWDTHPKEFSFNIPNMTYNKDNKNVLLILPWMTLGGADKFNLHVVEKLYKEGYKVTIVTTKASKYIWRQKFEEFAEVFDLTSFLDRKDWAPFILYLLKSRNINLGIISNSQYGYYVLPWLKCNCPNIPFIDYIHMEEWYWRDGGYPRDSIAVEKYLDHTYTCTKHLINTMREEMNKKKNDIDVVYIGTESSKFDPNIISLPDDECLDKFKDKKKIIFPCRIVDQKRPFLMIEVLNKLVKHRKDICFVVIGDGNLLKKVKQKVLDYGLKEYIAFIPAKNDIREYYKIADATLICSMIEGLSLTAYESLSMGVPVITSDVGGQCELVDNSCGKVVPLYQDPNKDINNYNYSAKEIDEYVKAIIYVVEHEEIKNNCRKRILEKFTVEQMQNNMLNIIEKFIKNGTSIKKEEFLNDYNLAERFLILYNEIDRNYYLNPDENEKRSKLEKIRDYMWGFATYRGTIKILQMTGIMKTLKRIKKNASSNKSNSLSE